MTKSKTMKIVIVFLSVLLVCAVAVCVYRNYVFDHPRNVFEEMYYTQAYRSERMPYRFQLYTDCGVFVKWYKDNGATLCTFYYKETVTMNVKVVIDCYKSPEKQLIISYYDFDHGQNRSVVYDLKTRSLKTKDTDIAFLYDILLPAWFDGMGGRSSFSMDDLGAFVIE